MEKFAQRYNFLVFKVFYSCFKIRHISGVYYFTFFVALYPNGPLFYWNRMARPIILIKKTPVMRGR